MNGKNKKKKWKIVAMIFVLILLTGYYLYYENTTLKVTTYLIDQNSIPDDFDGYKIVQISDLHNTASEKLRSTVIKEIKAQDPDMIALTGDMIDSRKTNIEIALRLIEEIKDVAPIYFVSGNHEARVESYALLKEKLKENGVILLENRAVSIKKGEAEISLIGIDDPAMAHESYVEDSEIVKVELNQCDFDKRGYSILLSHRPELLDTYTKNDIDLVLTGHAHGGQIRLPFLGGIVAPNQGLFPKYTSGTFEKEGTTMIVSRGIGNSIFPYRINNRPELVVAVLHKSEKR